MGRLKVAALPLALVCFCPPALADNPSAADVLFEAARSAMDRGDYDEACMKLQESLRSERATGTLLNLGRCEELRGRVASAWDYYLQAMEMMSDDDRRYAVAKAKAEELEPLVPRLVIRLGKRSPVATRVHVDNKALSVALGTPLQLDPGEHTIEIRAPGHETVRQTVFLELGETKRLEVKPGPETVARRPAPAPPVEPAPAPVREGEAEYTALHWTLGGVAATTLVAGGVFAVLSYRDWTTVREHCEMRANPHLCDQRGLDARDSGVKLGITAMVMGGVGVVSAATLLVIGPSSSEVSVQAGRFVGFDGVRITTRL